MKKYFCNPVNINYRYQFNQDTTQGNQIIIDREAADPSMILFRGRYYIFASMTLGVWVSDDLVKWENHRLPDSLPLYDYAPDVRVMGEYVYFCASKRGEACNFYRTKDVLNGPYEEIPGTFDFWDPNLFVDDDGRVYFYWGCASVKPIWGVELDPETMKPIGEKKGLIWGDSFSKGFERMGEDNSILPLTSEELDAAVKAFMKKQGIPEDMEIPEVQLDMLKGYLGKAPYIEGAWMNKFNGKYYLQYAFAGAQYNIYGDGVYVADSPLGDFKPLKSNPYSFNPGGFMPGAGHGSTMEDKAGNLWHTATMRISVHHSFERRVGIWQAGLDEEGDLFCNQRYGDWPMSLEEGEKQDPWREPEWYLLSYQKAVTASSYEEGKGPEKAADENVQTWWRAATEEPGQWLQMDLGEAYDVHAVQINFADDKIKIPVPGEIHQTSQPRYIDDRDHLTRWTLEGSLDGRDWFMLEDKSKARTDLTHDFLVWEEGKQIRFLKLTILAVAYDQKPCISGLRVFGRGSGAPAKAPKFTAKRLSEIDMEVSIEDSGATGYNILWGLSPDKLYHSYLLFGTEKRIGALMKGSEYYVRVDAFNENGITHGQTVMLGRG